MEVASLEPYNTHRIKGIASAGGVLSTAALLAGKAHAQGGDAIRIGLLGCGGRGMGAVLHCLQADPGVELVALADLLDVKVQGAVKTFAHDPKYAPFKDRVKVTREQCYTGFDCHEKLAQSNADLLLMATAPAFRGRQMMAAVKAGKHIFTEKPVATDVAGCRQVMEVARIAQEKGLAIVAGTQRRHEFSRVELMKRIHGDAIGDLVGGQCYWYGGGIWYREPLQGMSELEWQCHNWYHFGWLSGDQICEQHIHNIDVMNWCFQGPPKVFMSIGGRAYRDHNKPQEKAARAVCRHFNNGSEENWRKYNGDIWDHMFCELEYENGARCMSYSGHSPGTGRGGEKIVGTKGTSNCSNKIEGETPWEFKGEHVNGQQQEHIDLIKSIRDGQPLNEGQRVAESTLTTIGARMAAYTGRSFKYSWLLNSSKHSWVPGPDQLRAGAGIFHATPSGCDPLI